MLRALVTGGAGFIGSHLVEALLRAGLAVTVVDDLSASRRRWVPRAARFRKLDVRSDKLALLVREVKPDYVCHLAAAVGVSKSHEAAAADASVNIVGSVNVLEAVRQLKLQKFLFVSSAAVYGEPRELPTSEGAAISLLSPYALAKYTVERYLEYFEKVWGLPVVTVRPANVYGPRQAASAEGGVVAIFARALLAGQALTIHGRGEQTRDFIYVGDAAAGMLAALVGGRGVYNLSSERELSVRELAVRMGEVAGVVPKVTYGPVRPGDVPRSALRNARAERELNWHPEVPLDEGLRQTLKWFRTEAN